MLCRGEKRDKRCEVWMMSIADDGNASNQPSIREKVGPLNVNMMPNLSRPILEPPLLMLRPRLLVVRQSYCSSTNKSYVSLCVRRMLGSRAGGLFGYLI